MSSAIYVEVLGRRRCGFGGLEGLGCMVHVAWASLYRNFVRKLPTTLVAPSLAPLALVKGVLLASFFFNGYVSVSAYSCDAFLHHELGA